MTCIVEVEFCVKESPDFERVLGEEAVWDIAWEAAHALLEFEEEEEIAEIVSEAVIRSGVAAAEAKSTANEILHKHPEELRQAVRDALVCEAVEALVPTPDDVDKALEYRRNRYAASTWEAALEACSPPPVDVLAGHLRPKNLACPLGPVELEELVDCHWVEELVNDAENAVYLEWQVEPDLTVRVKLKAGPALVELLSLAVQARGGFGLRSDMSLEEVLAAAEFAGIEVEKMLEPFRWWLHDFAGSLQRRLVEALVNVVNRRWEWWYPKGKHVVEFLREYGLLKPAETLEPVAC